MFEKSRNNSLKNYGLCSRHYLRAPGLSWNAMLEMTKIELNFITDPDMHIFFEKGARGEIKSKANNKYLKSHGPKEKSKLVYILRRKIYIVLQCLNFFQQVGSNG